MRILFLFLMLVALVACDKPTPKGPGMSTVPCAENCGNDPNCNKNCTPTGTQSPAVPPIR